MDLQSLAERVRELERANQRLRWMFAAVILAVGTAGALGFARFEDSEPASTGSLVLKDADGKARGWFNVKENGIALAFGDGETARAGLVLSAEGVTLRYFNRAGEPVSGLCVLESGIVPAAKIPSKGVVSGQNALVFDAARALAVDPILRPAGKQK